MRPPRTYEVKEVATLSGLSARALHHYDAIGLLVPSLRSAADSRLYDAADLLRLQQILIGRELGLSLEEIRRSLDDPSFDRRQVLQQQRAALARRAQRTAEMLRAIDAAIAMLDRDRDAAIVEQVCDAPRSGDPFDGDEDPPLDFATVFAGFDPERHADEALRRWGPADAYRVSAERTKAYSDADSKYFHAEQTAIYAAAAAALRSGNGPQHPAAMDVAERHRLSIDRWFYPCSTQMHAALAGLYEADARFSENIDKHGRGLTAFLAEAIRANAGRGTSE
jgi:DNA-binding transcriptional MerR regulator